MEEGESAFDRIPGGADPEVYDRVRRRVLWSMPTGLFVVGSQAGERVNLMTANWVMQIALTPKLVAAAVERGAVTRRLVEDGGGFAVSILSRDDRALVRRFVKPVREVARDAAGAVTALQGQPVQLVGAGWPVLASSLGWLACRLRTTCTWEGIGADSTSDEPSHVLFVGEVVDAGERPPAAGVVPEVLRIEDTRMSYGG